jgi:hypothetical protein
MVSSAPRHLSVGIGEHQKGMAGDIVSDVGERSYCRLNVVASILVKWGVDECFAEVEWLKERSGFLGHEQR